MALATKFATFLLIAILPAWPLFAASTTTTTTSTMTTTTMTTLTTTTTTMMMQTTLLLNIDKFLSIDGIFGDNDSHVEGVPDSVESFGSID